MKIMVLLVLFFFGSTIQAQKTFELRYLGNMGVAMIHQDSVIIIDGEKNKKRIWRILLLGNGSQWKFMGTSCYNRRRSEGVLKALMVTEVSVTMVRLPTRIGRRGVTDRKVMDTGVEVPMI